MVYFINYLLGGHVINTTLPTVLAAAFASLASIGTESERRPFVLLGSSLLVQVASQALRPSIRTLFSVDPNSF